MTHSTAILRTRSEAPPAPSRADSSARPSRAARRTQAAGLLALLAGTLAGCAANTTDPTWWNPAGIGPAPVSPPPAVGVILPVRAADPLAAFAARAQPGQAETVTTPGTSTGGARTVSARLVRVYNAASGRECRELQFGVAGPGGAPGATYCRDPAQGWVAARALLRGGAVYRP